MPPSFVVSVASESGEYMITVVCEEHRNAIEFKLKESQRVGKIPKGTIVFQPVKMVSTDCIMGLEQDYVDIELNRGINSERRAT